MKIPESASIARSNCCCCCCYGALTAGRAGSRLALATRLLRYLAYC